MHRWQHTVGMGCELYATEKEMFDPSFLTELANFSFSLGMAGALYASAKSKSLSGVALIDDRNVGNEHDRPWIYILVRACSGFASHAWFVMCCQNYSRQTLPINSSYSIARSQRRSCDIQAMYIFPPKACIRYLNFYTKLHTFVLRVYCNA